MRPIRKILIVIILLTGFIFGVSFSTLYAQTHISEGTACSCTLPIPILIPTLSSLGVFIGSVVYYMMSPKTEKDKEKYRNDMKMLLGVLPNDEGEIVKMLMDNNGEITQSKLSSKFGRVKTFRTIERLRMRGVIEKEPYGKTNIIKLNEIFRQILCS